MSHQLFMLIIDAGIFTCSSEKEFLDIIEQCIGHIGHALGRDSQRYLCQTNTFMHVLASTMLLETCNVALIIIPNYQKTLTQYLLTKQLYTCLSLPSDQTFCRQITGYMMGVDDHRVA